MKRSGSMFLLLFIYGTLGCGSTWTDDAGNFKRIFHFEKPRNVEVIHSYYAVPPSWRGSGYRYYIAVRGMGDFRSEAERRDEFTSETANATSRLGCGPDPPNWFVAKGSDHYDMWVSKAYSGVRVFIDKDDNTMFGCAGKPDGGWSLPTLP